ncbi:MAG: DNA internalization-related competence protein ComEC/Rec2 [Gammaproteobacteria bacterium]
MRRFAILFLAGVLALNAVPVLPPAWLPAILFAISVVGLLWSHTRILTALTLGFCWAWLAASALLADRLPEALTGRDLEIVGEIISIPEPRAFGMRFLFAPEQVAGGTKLPQRIRLNWYQPQHEVRPGERWQLRVRLRHPRGAVNPGGFDYEAWLHRRGIGATGYVRQSDRNTRLGEAPAYSLPGLRSSIDRKLGDYAGKRSSRGLISALAVGVRHHIDSDRWRVLAATGLSHLIAISGLHIGLVAGLVFLITRSIVTRLPGFRRWPPVDIATVAGLACATVYAAMAGFSLPTVRALVMLAAFSAARLGRRQTDASRSLCLALVAVLIVDPLAVLAPGFWLSFAAVFGLITGMSLRRGAEHRARQLLRMQAVLFVVLAPILLGSLGRMSLIGLAVNLLAIPLFGLIIIPGVLLAMVLLGWMPDTAGLLIRCLADALDWLWPGLEWLAHWPPTLWEPATRPWPLLISMFAGSLLIAAPRGVPGRWLGLLMALPVLLWCPPAPAPGEYRLTMLDVGQGLAVVLQTAGHVLVYDTGPAYRGGGNAAALTLLPFLSSRGIRAIDILVVSHADQDHAGGSVGLLDAFPVATHLSGSADRDDDSAKPCHAGMRWHWDGVDFAVLHPGAGESWDRNNGSCVLRVSGPGGSLLLTGDIEREAEAVLVAGGRDITADIIVVPHHGSRTSSTASFVAAVRPRFALFAVGYGNPWGFPKPEIVARWSEAGARTLETANSGAIEISVRPLDGIALPVEYRRRQRRYWTAD